MSYVLLGSLAFVLLTIYDYLKLKNKGSVKDIFSICGLGLIIVSGIMILITSNKIYIHILIRIPSIILSFLFLTLLIYSLFIELPFKSTYTSNKYNEDLVNTGTYALTRHPGVLWFFLFFLFLFLGTGYTLLVPACIVWTSLDVIHVYIQDKIFFVKMFKGYKNYQKTTPMLIPNKESIKKCINTIFIGGKTHANF
ncbi:hypothetical protein CLOTH_16010 [Alkalithermobacter paradoxus]|uniref:Isoprenylcysteine carboxyl methyltransferase (ICMT) family protein n=1 Tax=Alkalithermobacter paradoxus TaxID=29349 RepID=A0A1V4I5N1_9FIRM|nr:hypothetical protein CLOTH_16010 [[Clostridium] thermoalcaliphilum]